MNDSDVDDMIDQATRESSGEVEQRRDRDTSRMSRLKQWIRRHPKRAGLMGVAMAAGLVLAIPMTRYATIGMFITRDVVFTVVDSQTGRPVTDATVTVRGKQLQTDSVGTAQFTAQKPGTVKATVSKKFYNSVESRATIAITNQTYQATVTLQATGRQVPLLVTNKISGKPINNATIVAAGTQTTTDTMGNAQLVLDAGTMTVEAEISADGFNKQRTNLSISEDVSANTIALTPQGKVYILSKQSGNLDVVKLNLDGTEREVAVKATGNEEVTNSYLVPTSDWKFVLLHTRRDGNKSALYLIDTKTDKLTEIDTTNAVFDIAGWSGHTLVYTLQRSGYDDWQPGRQQIKQFDANSGQLTNIDKTAGNGKSYDNYAAQNYTGVHIVDGRLVFAKQWSGTSPDIAKQDNALYAVELGSTNIQTVRSFGNTPIAVAQPTPNKLYLQSSQNQLASYFVYENTTLRPAPELTQAQFTTFVPRFFISPAGDTVAWSDPIDGRFRTYVGGLDLADKRLQLDNSEWAAFGWFGDDYLLMSKANSELAIVSRGNTSNEPQKITDYHRPPGRGALF